MALASGAVPAGRQPSPSSLTFGSNNPFRNRMGGTSPSPRNEHPGSQQFPFPGMSSNSTSKNPFLDPEPNGAVVNGGHQKPSDDLDVFKELSLLDKPATNGPPPSRIPPGSQHRLGGADDRLRAPPPYSSRSPSSPSKRPEHQRRASESSIMEEKDRRDRRERGDRGDRGDRPPRTESEERRRRERRREREERHRREKERVRNGGAPSKSGASSKKPKNLDIIDKLDVTGIYGQGLFHHDGPFDACNPHRNARKDRRAPMQAFPEGSANMALGGAGPLRSRIDLDKFHGRGEEGFQDYAITRKADSTTYVNPTDRSEQVHGQESYGLGTSTFLEGAPASKAALQRRESEDQYTAGAGDGGGLARKKSLAQRLRGMSNSQRARPNDLRSPEGRYNPVLIDTSSPPRGDRGIPSHSAGGMRRAKTRDQEIDPFDEYDAAFEKKGQQIQFAEQERPARARAPSSPKGYAAPGLTRSVTADSAINSGDGEAGKSSGGGGLLNRMRSLKGGRRQRPERKDSNGMA